MATPSDVPHGSHLVASVGAAEAPPAVERPAPEPVPVRPTRGPTRTWRLLQRLHRWTSLVLGVLLLLVVLSGVVLVIDPEIHEWTHPSLYRGTQSAEPITPGEAVAIVRRELPKEQPVDVVRNRGVYEVFLGEEYAKEAHIDPGTGKLLGVGSHQSGVMGFLQNLHMCALSCEGYPGYLSFLNAGTPLLGNDELTVGGLILGVSGLLLIFLAISGVVLWWPGIRRMARGFRIRRRKGTYAFNYDLHNVVGMAAVPFLLMWAITGAAFEFKQFGDAWYALVPGKAPAEYEDMTSKPGGGSISIDRAEQIALAAVPGSTPVSVSVPDPKVKDSAYSIYVAHGSDPYDHGTYPGNVGVGVDRYSGKAKITYGAPDSPVAQELWEGWSYPLHAGYFTGWGWRSPWLVFGLVPLLLAVTGVTTWWLRRRKRRRKRSRAAAMASA